MVEDHFRASQPWNEPVGSASIPSSPDPRATLHRRKQTAPVGMVKQRPRRWLTEAELEQLYSWPEFPFLLAWLSNDHPR